MADVFTLGTGMSLDLGRRSAEPVLLVPRRTFFRNPDRANLQLSSDGAQLAWSEPVAGIQNVFVAPLNDIARARHVTKETQRSISGYLCAYTNRHLVVLRDSDGDEYYRCQSVDLDTGKELTLTEQPGVRSFIWRASRDYPADMLFGVNARDRRHFDVARIDVTTGESRLVFENPGYPGLLIDDTLTVRLAVRVRKDGTVEVLEVGRDGSTTPFLDVPHSLQ
jgi:hypothetical protein